MRIAVIGAGIYGSTIALKLAEAGHDVELVEREAAPLSVTTDIGVRSHHGYFYPRSPETVDECRTYAPRFEKYYPEAIVRDIRHFYAIARDGSKLSGQAYLDALARNGLPYRRAEHTLLNPGSVDTVIEVPEHSYDHVRLKESIRSRLRTSKVRLLLSTDARNLALERYDLVVLATYANTAVLSAALGHPDAGPYEYRLCEKAVVRLPREFSKQSFVIMDGPFFQLEPLGNHPDLFLLSHGAHSAHLAWSGHSFTPPAHLAGLLGRGLVPPDASSRFKTFIESASTFVPRISEAEHVGSFFAIKILSPDQNDARRTMVRPLRHNLISVFSGKVAGSIRAAEECVAYAAKLAKEAASPTHPGTLLQEA